jgi:deoxyribose-phosphate aldolase
LEASLLATAHSPFTTHYFILLLGMQLAHYIDHTVLKPTTTLTDIERLCAEATAYNFAAVCVPPLFVKKAKELLVGTPVKVATVIGFPFGYQYLCY